MNRTFNRRYRAKISDQTIESNDSRWRDSKENSEESSDDDDDDDEDDDEDHSRNQDSEYSEEESISNRREWEALARYLKSQKAYAERNPSDSFHRTYGTKKDRKDKTTQKNLTSPLPSIWKPPVYKEISSGPKFKVIKSKEIGNRESDFMLRYLTGMQSNSFSCKNEKKHCPHKPTPTEIFKKFYMKHKKEAESRPKKDHCKKFHTCIGMNLSGGEEHPPEMDTKKQENGKDAIIHSQCGLPIRSRQQYQRKEPESEKSGKVKEKLVYVVEGEGESVARMETDLFSLNEILAIKKDLLELSEFAKKLKKLKDMKRESQKDKNSEAECQCKAVTELLRDVNKRMVALEERQEELERIQKFKEIEMDTKKTDDTNTSSVSPTRGVVKLEPSAVKSFSSFKESEMTNVSREGALSKNLEIVNELLDIKSQLQRLEKRRMSKELSAEVGPAGNMNVKTKDQPINVFSSKTYILTSDAYNKKKNDKETAEMKRNSGSDSSMKEKAPANLERFEVKDSVVEWLNNIPTRRSPNRTRKEDPDPDTQEESWGVSSTRHPTPEVETNEKQEPQKNRAKDARRLETIHAGPKVSREIPSQPHRKEERFTSEQFLLKYKPKERWDREDSDKYFARPVPPKPEKALVKAQKIPSTSSVPSAMLPNEHIGHVKHFRPNISRNKIVKPSRSKSVHEFTTSSCLSKHEKMLLNMKRKNAESNYDSKRENEEEVERENELGNENNQGELNNILNYLKSISLNRSQLVATMNLDGESTDFNREEERNATRTLPLFPFPILPPEVYKILECCEEHNELHSEERSEECEENRKRCRRDPCEKKSTKHSRDEDTCCKKKCRKKKKTRIKCSRNHCCNKKARKAALAASRSSCCHHQRSSSSSCRKPLKKCQCKKCCEKKTPSSSSSLTPKDEEEESRKKESTEEKILTNCCRKKRHQECRKHKPKKTCQHKKKKEHTHCCCSRKRSSPCQKCCETIRPTTPEPTFEEIEKCESRNKPQRLICTTSENTSDSPRKSSLKHSEPEQQSRSFLDDPCYMASLWRTLRKIYPRFSALQLMSWLRLYCHDEKRTKEQCVQKKRKGETPKPRETRTKHNCPTCQCKSPPQHYQCCKSYRMSTSRHKWPGVGPSSEISKYSITEAETQSCDTSTETDFMFPYRKPNLYYTYKATNEEDETEEPKKKKKCKRKKRKKSKKSSSSEEGSETEKKNCKCDRCGYVHAKKQKKVSYNKSSCKPEKEKDSEAENESSKSTKKSKKSIFARLGEVRHLQVCEGRLKCPKFRGSKSQTDCGCISGESRCKCGAKKKSSRKGDAKKDGNGKICPCKLKLEELENRIALLESDTERKHKKDESEENDESKKGKKRKKKKKKEKEKEREESNSEDECEVKEEKNKKKRKKKKKKEKEESNSEDECEVKEEKNKKKRKKKKKKEKEESNSEDECEVKEEKSKKEKKKRKKKEKEESNSEDECEVKEEKTKKERKKKKKKEETEKDECKNKRRKREEDDDGKNRKCSNEDCHCAEVDKKKNQKKKAKGKKEESENCDCDGETMDEKKRGKKKKRSNSADEENEVATHYCKCMGPTFKTNERDGETATTSSEKSSFKKIFEKKKKEVLEKLLSLTSFWRNFQRKQSDYILIDDSSRSSEMPRKRSIWPSETEPSLIGKLKKQKKDKKDKKTKEKKVRKSKSKVHRHR